jgi:hypothetical protein
MRPASPEPLGTSAEADGSAAQRPACASFYTARDLRNQRRFLAWMLAGSLAYVGATLALKRQAVPRALAWALAGLAWLLAILAVRSYLLFLRQADELLRRIELEALALGFGAGAVFSLLYPLLERLGAPELGGYATPLVMMLSWSAGAWLGTRRYSGRGAP